MERFFDSVQDESSIDRDVSSVFDDDFITGDDDLSLELWN